MIDQVFSSQEISYLVIDGHQTLPLPLPLVPPQQWLETESQSVRGKHKNTSVKTLFCQQKLQLFCTSVSASTQCVGSNAKPGDTTGVIEALSLSITGWTLTVSLHRAFSFWCNLPNVSGPYLWRRTQALLLKWAPWGARSHLSKYLQPFFFRKAALCILLSHKMTCSACMFAHFSTQIVILF